MEPRLDFYKASPEATKAMLALSAAVSKLGLEPLLSELVKLRASQINGCAYCVDMHSTDARKRGAGLDRSAHARRRHARTRRRLRSAVRRVQRTRARRPHADHQRHQCVEPAGGRLPLRACRMK